MKPPAPLPMFDGTTPISAIDAAGEKVYRGVKSGAFAGARRELEQQVRALEQKLPPTSVKPRRGRASLTAAEIRMISPHSHTASGARNSAADAVLIQRVHDALSRLGATCGSGSADDGNENPPLATSFHPGADD